MGDASNAYSYIAPQYVRQVLAYVWKTFNPSEILIAEFGFPVFDEANKTLPAQQYDLERSIYYQTYLQEVGRAISVEKINVIGALAWSIMDDNKFGSYTSQYGMQHVDRVNGRFMRSFKRSFFDYVDFFGKHVNKNECN